MKKRLYLLLVTVVLSACVLTGCSGCNKEVAEEIVSEDVSEAEDATESPPEEDVGAVDEDVETETDTSEDMDTSENVSEDTEDVSETEEVDTSQGTTEITTEETTEDATEEVSEEEPSYAVEPMDAVMYAQRSVNVRSGPGTEYDRLGSLNTNDEVKVTGKADTGWYEIEYNGTKAYVSNNYLGNDKVVVQNTTPPADTGNNTGANTGNTGGTTAPNTAGVATRDIFGSTRYAFRTTANGTPIYDTIDWQWPQYITDVINACCTPQMSDLEKANAIYSWMVANVSYGTSTTTSATLSNRSGNCQGKANTYQSLCSAVGITCSVVDGASVSDNGGNNNHAWNFLTVNSTRYYVDCTWCKAPASNIVFGEPMYEGSYLTLMEVYDANGNIYARLWYRSEWIEGMYDTI